MVVSLSIGSNFFSNATSYQHVYDRDGDLRKRRWSEIQILTSQVIKSRSLWGFVDNRVITLFGKRKSGQVRHDCSFFFWNVYILFVYFFLCMQFSFLVCFVFTFDGLLLVFKSFFFFSKSTANWRRFGFASTSSLSRSQSDELIEISLMRTRLRSGPNVSSISLINLEVTKIKTK